MSNEQILGRVFAESDGSHEDFPGFLLINHGHTATADQRMLAWVYGQNTLRSIEFGLGNRDVPEAAYPALFMVRHTLELYLKGLVPDWEKQRGEKNRHQIDYLVDILHAELMITFDENSVSSLSRLLKQFAVLDPKSMAFRFQDGAKVSFGKEPLQDPEIWVDFHALKEAMALTFDALDKVWHKRLNEGSAK